MPQKYQLKNGLKVLLIESKKSPVVSVQAWVNTGSADEKKGIEGISHFIEHLVFKGSKKFNVGEMAASVEGAGGVLNAYTTFDQTVFYVTLSKEHVETGLEVISEMMGAPKFDENEINNEREVVIEEIKRSLDSPRSVASKMLFSTMYTKHPYGIPVIGYDDNIRRVSKEQILNYFHGRYSPQNINLVVVGDFNAKDMKSQIERHFGEMKKFKVIAVKRKKDPATKKNKIVAVNSQYHDNYIYLAWPGPKIKSKDVLPLTLLSAILGEGESSRIVNAVKNQKNLAQSIGCYLFTAKDSGFFGIVSTLQAEKIQPAFDEILLQLKQFFSEGIRPEELDRAKRQIESEKLYSMETVDGLAGLYGQYEFFHGDYKKVEDQLAQLSSLTPKDILRVARAYLKPDQLRFSCLVKDSKSVEKMAAKFIADYKKIFALATKNKVVKSKKSAPLKWKMRGGTSNQLPERFVLDNGARVLCKKISGSPVISVRAAGLGGLRYEDNKKNGLNELAARVWATGTKNKNEEQYHQELEGIATSISAFGGRNSIGISMTTLVPFANKASACFSEIMNEPLFSERVLDREKKQMLDLILSRKDKPAQKCLLALTQKIYGEHPYGKDPLGTPESLKGINVDDVDSYIWGTLTRPNTVYSIVGDFSTESWLKKITEISDKRRTTKLAKVTHSFKGIQETSALYEKMDKQQTHIALAYEGLTLQDPRRHTLDVMQAILSGQGGRLFVELRDKASLAYTVSPIRMDGLEPGYFGTYIGCSPDKAQKAYQMMKHELMQLGEHKVSDAEVERAKRYLIGRHDISCQRTGSIAEAMLFDELYGLPFDDFEKHNEHIRSVTAADIQKLAQEIFSKSFVLSVVGQENVSI